MTDKKITDKVNKYLSIFQDDIRQKIIELNFDSEKASELLEYLYNYPKMEITKEDLNKRQRAPNATPIQNRCTAKKSTGEQCTRKRKEGCEFCGTHDKHRVDNNEPNSQNDTNSVIIPVAKPSRSNSKNNANSFQKVEITAFDLSGIVYYVDKYNNVYQPEDVVDCKENPRIIGKYNKDNNEIELIIGMQRLQIV